MKTICTQKSLFPESYYIGRIIQNCDEQVRQKNVMKMDQLIKITPMLNELRKAVK